jgi:hypothetical protein
MMNELDSHGWKFYNRSYSSDSTIFINRSFCFSNFQNDEIFETKMVTVSRLWLELSSSAQRVTDTFSMERVKETKDCWNIIKKQCK